MLQYLTRIFSILGRMKKLAKAWCHTVPTSPSTASNSLGKISATAMNRILECLKSLQHRDSTARMYLSVWRQFNSFLIKLDIMPRDWEDRTSLFIAHLIHKHRFQSTSVKSYVLAIKKTLVIDGYKWIDEKILLSSLTRACKLVNDHVRMRFPIQCGLLEIILFEFE